MHLILVSSYTFLTFSLFQCFHFTHPALFMKDPSIAPSSFHKRSLIAIWSYLFIRIQFLWYLALCFSGHRGMSRLFFESTVLPPSVSSRLVKRHGFQPSFSLQVCWSVLSRAEPSFSDFCYCILTHCFVSVFLDNVMEGDPWIPVSWRPLEVW